MPLGVPESPLPLLLFLGYISECGALYATMCSQSHSRSMRISRLMSSAVSASSGSTCSWRDRYPFAILAVSAPISATSQPHLGPHLGRIAAHLNCNLLVAAHADIDAAARARAEVAREHGLARVRPCPVPARRKPIVPWRRLSEHAARLCSLLPHAVGLGQGKARLAMLVHTLRWADPRVL